MNKRGITAAEFEKALRNVNAKFPSAKQLLNPTPPEVEMEDPERYRIYRLCECGACQGSGKDLLSDGKIARCATCRGEGRSLDLVATATSPEAVGVALITLGLEGEWEECPVGIMDRPEGETGKWVLKPWLPSARNLSDAGRQLAHARHQQ